MQNALPGSWQARLTAARTRFIDGEPLPASLLPSTVARSWERSRNAGLMPWQAPQYELLDPKIRVRESHDDRRLYSCVVDEVEPLWAAFGGDDWTIFCANREGMVLHARQSPSCANPLLLPIVAGRRVLESFIGTTAPSCVIHDGGEVVVDGSQHYLSEFSPIFCLAVPLFGLDGEVIGALDISGTGQRNVSQVREQFRLAALAAEQRLFATLRDCHLLRLQHDPRWLATPMAGILAVDDDGQVRAASRLARNMLALSQGGALASIDLAQLFADASPVQRRQLLRASDHPQRIARADGSHLWVQYVRASMSRSTARRGGNGLAGADAKGTPIDVTRLDDASLREQSLDAIQRAVREQDGNIAAAARQLGISRTTVYAKLKQLRRAGIAEDVALPTRL